jgi:myo-inositol-1(or 4)-monophosphatase
VSPDPDENQRLLDLAVDVAREAAALVRAGRRDGVDVAATKSSDIDVVTQTDRDSEELLRRRIGEARPGDGFLGEEGHDEQGSSGVRWIVDPIDGTVNFLYGIPHYAVSVAAERAGVVVAGVVVNVATGAEYTAVRGTDGETGTAVTALRDGVPLAVRGEAPLSQRLIATGFSYQAEQRVIQAAATARLLPHIRDIRRLGSCALDLCHVAEGTLDGYVEEGVNPWDHAAGALVAEGAGATVELATGRGGRELIMCAPEHGFRTFREAVEDAGFLRAAGE